MLDVTDRDIADLDDTDLRSLIAFLAEATLRHRQLSTAAISWGGDQNAPDGGIDVRVELAVGTAMSGFVPRPCTGFQVKKSPMGPAEIRLEMRPENILRESISRLVTKGGAYIIASSGSNLSDSALAIRREAMRLALDDHPNASTLAVDFYDRQRIATWVRDFPGLAPWVRAKVGRPMQGWRSFGDWSFAGNNSAGKFIADDKVRLYVGTARTRQSETAISTLSGLQLMRATLMRTGSSLRLIGLSGVGKTRLVQALFEGGIGNEALDSHLAIYTDLALHPEPTPVAVATYLVQRQSSSIIIVDNCPAELHRQLTQVCQSPGSTVSLVTVEYDIRDDTPEGTDVFRLEVASDDVVARLVAAHCPWLSQVDARSIGVFSGGNARVGLALAQTVRIGESLSGLSDESLFYRLFRQRHGDDAGLLAAAEASALVYSFDGELSTGARPEIECLAALADCTPTVLHRHIAEMVRRGLLQTRGQWRAVLPHAIANRLAERALENIPQPRLQQELVENAPERLLQSYSRRLSYLHGSTNAVRIAREWLSSSGLLGVHVGNLSALGMALFANIAPVAPEAALAAIERVRDIEVAPPFFSVENRHRDRLVHLIRKIAYDAALFERCADLIVCFALTAIDARKYRNDQTLDIWRSLFSPFLSGTHASISQRMQILDILLRSDCCKKHKLAIIALNATLETSHFSSAHGFDFGARSRDYGYQPSTAAEQTEWFSTGIKLATAVGASTGPSASKVREAFAGKLPGLWVRTATQDLIATAIETFAKDAFWEDGWVAVKEAIWISRSRPDGASDRLLILEEWLAPKTLLEKIHVHVIRDRNWVLDTEDTSDAIVAAMARADALAEKLGRCAAADHYVLDQILPELVSSGSGRRWQFARGLTRNAVDRPVIWSKLVDAAARSVPEANPAALGGFLSAWQEVDSAAARAMVDQAINDVRTTRWAPFLEIAVGLNESSVERLHRALAAGAPPAAFSILAFGRLTDAILPADLSSLLCSIAATTDGWEVAIDILAMRLRSSQLGEVGSLLELGRTLLLKVDPRSGAHHRLDHDLSTVVSACLIGPDVLETATALCRLLSEAFGTRAVSFHELRDFVKAVFRTQPIAALDAFLQTPPDDNFRYPTILNMFEDVAEFHRNPIGEVADETVIEWCAKDPLRNFAAAATSVPYSYKAPDETDLTWTVVAQRMLELAPEPCDVLKAFIDRFEPDSWSGSRAAIIQANASLLVSVENSACEQLASLARAERRRLLVEIQKERQRESERSRYDDERFE